MQKYRPIRVESINPFVRATGAVFRTMLECDVRRGQLYIKKGHLPDHEISGVIGLVGRAIGTVVLSLNRRVALMAASTLLGEEKLAIDEEVVDAIGELTNIIAGNAKAELEQLEINLGLPNVVIGKNNIITFPSEVCPIGIPFDCEWGAVSVVVGMSERFSQEAEDGAEYADEIDTAAQAADTP